MDCPVYIENYFKLEQENKEDDSSLSNESACNQKVQVEQSEDKTKFSYQS